MGKRSEADEYQQRRNIKLAVWTVPVSKIAIFKSPWRSQPLAPIAPNGTEGLLSTKPERVKIIAKRKFETDEPDRDGRISPNKKRQASSPVGEVGWGQAVGAKRDAAAMEGIEHRGEPWVDDFAVIVGRLFAPGGPLDWFRSSGLERPHAPKARRSPLTPLFLSLGMDESFLLSPPWQSSNPPTTSSPAPAKQSFLPARPAGPFSAYIPDTDILDDGLADQCGQDQSQSRMDFEMDTLNNGDEYGVNNEDEQETGDGENEAEACDELEFDVHMLEFDITPESDIPMLEEDTETSAEADYGDSSDTEEPGSADHTQSMQLARSIERHPSSLDFPVDPYLSPDGTSPSSEVLKKPKGHGELDTPRSFEDRLRNLLDKATTDRDVKLELGESIFFSTRSTRAQSSSGLTQSKAQMLAKLMAIKEAPTSANRLLATGVLTGFSVRYMDRLGRIMLTGRINTAGVVCDCSKCRGETTVSVSVFEKHAGSPARRPSDYIYLDNGKNLHEVMKAGWRAEENGRKVSEALCKAIWPEPDTILERACAQCETGDGEVTCSRCSNLHHLGCAGLDSQPDGDCQCSQCVSAENCPSPKMNSSLTREPSTGKDLNANLHNALFAPGGLEDGTDVGYYVKGQRCLTGIKSGLGILCGCCEKVVSCSQFEQHAGWSSRRNPYSSIYLADGQTLHMVALALGQRNGGLETADENMDYCTKCGDGGELILCDSCPGAYHPECAGLASIPNGDWFCPQCKRQRGTSSGSCRKVTSKAKLRGSRRAPGKESIDDRRRCRLKAMDTISSGCVFCRSGEFEKVFGPRTILLCDQCEREYHVGCLKQHGLAHLKELPEGEWFCGKDCERIHRILSLLVQNGMEPLTDSIVSKVLETEKQEGSTEVEEMPEQVTISWQLLHGQHGGPSNGETLDQAAAIFSNSFDPIVDGSSGRDLIPLMVHSLSIKNQEFGGMHCVVLKRNDEVVTAALVRIFGRQFAELPLVATKAGMTGKGFCKALILSIERLLGVLHVERLVLPAAEDAEGMWVKKFAFSRLPEDESRRYRSEVQLMIFKGSNLLQKSIPAVATK